MPADTLSWLTQTLPFVLLFLSTVLGVLGASMLVGGKGAIQQRLHGLPTRGLHRGAVSLRYGTRGFFYRLLVEPMRGKLVPEDPAEASSAGLRMIQAGFPNPEAVAVFYVTRTALALGVVIVMLFLSPLILHPLTTRELLLLASVIGLIGYFAPALYLRRRTAKRQRVFRDALPDALDLLLVCSEAGLSLDMAIARVGEEIGKPYPLLGEQFQLMSAELRAGKSREMALRSLAARMGIDEVSSLATVLIQSGALGTSIGAALRVYSDDMRVRRMTAAEEKAQKLAVKLAMMLILFILPPLMVAIMLPTMVHAYRLLASHPIVY